MHGALVVARDGDARRVAYVDLSDGIEIDRSWFAAAGMRASESHLVHFHGARVHALLGGPDELLRDPWFGRDAIRTAATWAGIADAARAAALEALAPRALAGDDLAALAVGRIDTHAQTIDLWLAEAGRRADAHPDAAMRTLSVHLREAVARAAQALVDEALRAAGSRPLARGGALDRAARDLRIFLLQHRLDPLLVRAGPRGGRPVTLQRENFEARYAADPDPWDFETSAYEPTSTSARWRRSAPSLGRAFEAGCSIGVFTAMLAERCDDCSPSTSRRPRSTPPASAWPPWTMSGSSAATLPGEWPAGPFDLVVCSELLYYWDRETLEASLPTIADSLAPGGRLVAVHYRPPSTIDPPDRGRCPCAPARAPGPRARGVRGQRPFPHRRLRRMRRDQRIVIVGGGPAALSTARSYREAGGEASIELICAEPHLPYRRPPLDQGLPARRDRARRPAARG